MAAKTARCAALVGPYLSGKTTLLESLLFATGRIPRKGSIKDKNTVGDASAEARARGMSTELNVAASEFLGGALAPGIEISLDALASRAAQLRKVELVPPRSVIGKNTVEALQSGALYGFAGQVDNLVTLIGEEVGAPLSAVIATGGLAPIVVPESRTITVLPRAGIFSVAAR